MDEITNEVNMLRVWFESHQQSLITFGINFLIAIVILLVGRMIAGFVSHWLLKLLDARQVDRTIGAFLGMIVRYAIYIFTFIAMLGQIGVQTTSVVAAVGAAGLAVGLALQGSLANFAAGVLLILFRPFKINESVDIGGASGTVVAIQIFSTTLRSSDGQMIVIPNNKVLASNILNVTREPERRIEIKLPINSRADVGKVKILLTDLVKKHPKVLANRAILVRLSDITFIQTTEVLMFTIQAWTLNDNYSSTQYDLLESFKTVIDEHQLGVTSAG